MPRLLAPEFTVVAESPDHHRHYTGSPCLIADGPERLLCSWEWFQPPPVTETIPNQLHIAASEDEGRTWSVLSRQDMTWPSLFKVEDAVYLLGSRRMTREIVIQRSLDGGASWTPESVLFKGRYHGAATNILHHNGHVYRAYETCPLDQPGGRGRSDWHSLVVAGNPGGDLLSPASWRMSNHLPFPGVPDVLHGRRREPDYPRRVMEDCWIEGNVVCVNGELRNILRTCIDGYSTGSIAAVNRVHDTDTGLVCEFMQYSAMPGAQCKFQIVHDPPSNLFWTAANLQTRSWHDWNTFQARTQAGPPGNERRILALLYSLDAVNWLQAGVVAMSRKPLEAFSYASILPYGSDLLILSRTSLGGINQHDTNLVTLHRVPRFRELALDLAMDLT